MTALELVRAGYEVGVILERHKAPDPPTEADITILANAVTRILANLGYAELLTEPDGRQTRIVHDLLDPENTMGLRW